MKLKLLLEWPFSRIYAFKMVKATICKQFAIYILIIQFAGASLHLLRNKRFLTFPRQAPTRHQFIGGIGIPADLTYESLTIGYVLKAMYWLPWNATHFRENPYLPEYKNDYNRNSTFPNRVQRSSSLRWDIYDIMANRLESYGYKGQECVMRAICEANAVKFLRQLDVFGALMHIFFSPSTSRDLTTDISQNFKDAEKQGSSLGDCTIYDCSLSILDLISSIMKIH